MEHHFGERLKEYRKERNLTQQELADRIQVSNKTVSRWESGGGYPDISMLIPLARTLGVTVDDLLDGETPLRTLTQADWQNLLSFSFSLGGGVLFYLLKIFMPTPVCYLAYLGAMAYGVYLQKYYCYQSRWFRIGNGIINFAVNISLIWTLATAVVVMLGMGDLSGLFFWLTTGKSFAPLLLLAGILLIAALLTAVTLYFVEYLGFGTRFRGKLKFALPEFRFFAPALGMALLTAFWCVFPLEQERMLTTLYTNQKWFYYGLFTVLIIVCLLLFCRPRLWIGLLPTAIMALGGLTLPGLTKEYALLATSKKFMEVTPTLSKMYPRIGIFTVNSTAAGIVFAALCLFLVLWRFERNTEK